MTIRILALHAILLTVAFSFSAHAEVSDWKVESVHLAPLPENRGHFTAVVSGAGRVQKVKLESDVPMDEILENYVSADKFVLLGHGGNTDSVVIFDLLRGTKIDWFYCYQPQRIWENSIAFVEWYPNHGQDRFTDVVLVYDLTKGPAENRQGTLRQSRISPTNPITVGFPIYPVSNAARNSYVNTVEDQADVRLILGPTNFLPMSKKRLVIAVGEEPGGDARTLTNHLEVVDLSQGFGKVTVKSFPIPIETLPQKSATAYVQITHMEKVSEHTILLQIPKTEYGADRIEVNVP